MRVSLIAIIAAAVTTLSVSTTQAQFTWSRVSHSISSESYVKYGIGDLYSWQYGYGNEQIGLDDDDFDGTSGSSAGTSVMVGTNPTHPFAESVNADIESLPDNGSTVGMSITGRSEGGVTAVAEVPDVPEWDDELAFASVWQTYEGSAIYELNGSGTASVSGLFEMAGLSNSQSSSYIVMDIRMYRGHNPDVNGMPQQWEQLFSAESSIGSPNAIGCNGWRWAEDIFGPYFGEPFEDGEVWTMVGMDDDFSTGFDFPNLPAGSVVKLEFFVETTHDVIVEDYQSHTGWFDVEVGIELTAN